LSTLSKVFIVILVVFSIAFSMLVIQSTAQTQNFKKLADENKTWAQREQALREAADNQHKVVVLQYQQTVADLQEQLDRQQQQLQQLQSQFSQQRNELLTEQQKVALLTAQAAQSSTLVKTLTAERQELQEQLAALRKQTSELKSVNFRLTEENNELQLQKELFSREINQLKEQNFALSERIDQLRDRLRSYEPGLAQAPVLKPGEQAVPVMPVVKAPIYGKVKEVREDLAAITVGSADGVKDGMEFIVYRGSQYLGKLRVTKVRTNESAGTLEQVEGTIQPGDDVADHFEF